MEIDLRTPKQKQKAERDKKIIEHFEAIIDADCSTWRKYCIVAEAIGVTPAHVRNIICSHNEQSDA